MSRAPAQAPSATALFLAFLGIGLSGFGGVLPFARRALVERRGWLDEAGFNETLALCQTLPGPNIVNLSVVVGSRFAGVAGAFASTAGLIGAPVCIVLVLASLWRRFGAIGHTPQAIAALGAAAAGLVVATAARMARPVLTERPVSGGLFVAAGFLAVGLARLPLTWTLAALAPLSVGLSWRSGR